MQFAIPPIILVIAFGWSTGLADRLIFGASDQIGEADLTGQIGAPTAISAVIVALVAFVAIAKAWRGGVFDLQQRRADAAVELANALEKQRDLAKAETERVALDWARDKADYVSLHVTPVLHAIADGFEQQRALTTAVKTDMEAMIGTLQEMAAFMAESAERRRQYDSTNGPVRDGRPNIPID